MLHMWFELAVVELSRQRMQCSCVHQMLLGTLQTRKGYIQLVRTLETQYQEHRQYKQPDQVMLVQSQRDTLDMRWTVQCCWMQNRQHTTDTHVVRVVLDIHPQHMHCMLFVRIVARQFQLHKQDMWLRLLQLWLNLVHRVGMWLVQ